MADFDMAVGADSLPYDDGALKNLIRLRNLNRFTAFTTGDGRKHLLTHVNQAPTKLERRLYCELDPMH